MPSAASRSVVLLLVASVALAGLGCRTAGTSDTTTSPTPATTTETFDGSFNQLGSANHPFTVSTTGTVTIGLTAVGPLSTMALGVGIGSWSGTTCSSAISRNDNARAGSTALSGTAGAGNYCILVYDSGNIGTGGTVTYTVRVVHP